MSQNHNNTSQHSSDNSHASATRNPFMLSNQPISLADLQASGQMILNSLENNGSLTATNVAGTGSRFPQAAQGQQQQQQAGGASWNTNQQQNNNPMAPFMVVTQLPLQATPFAQLLNQSAAAGNTTAPQQQQLQPSQQSFNPQQFNQQQQQRPQAAGASSSMNRMNSWSSLLQPTPLHPDFASLQQQLPVHGSQMMMPTNTAPAGQNQNEAPTKIQQQQQQPQQLSQEMSMALISSFLSGQKNVALPSMAGGSNTQQSQQQQQTSSNAPVPSPAPQNLLTLETPMQPVSRTNKSESSSTTHSNNLLSWKSVWDPQAASSSSRITTNTMSNTQQDSQQQQQSSSQSQQNSGQQQQQSTNFQRVVQPSKRTFSASALESTILPNEDDDWFSEIAPTPLAALTGQTVSTPQNIQAAPAQQQQQPEQIQQQQQQQAPNPSPAPGITNAPLVFQQTPMLQFQQQDTQSAMLASETMSRQLQLIQMQSQQMVQQFQQQQLQQQQQQAASTTADAGPPNTKKRRLNSTVSKRPEPAFLLPSTMMPPTVLASICTAGMPVAPVGPRKSKTSSTTPTVISGTDFANRITSKKAEAPQAFLVRLLEARGYGTKLRFPADHANYDTVPSPLQLASFGTELVKAVHTSDVTKLDDLLSSGLSPNPCNQFRDSVIDLVCKRSNERVFQCLVEHGSDLRVCDGFGRTPLHHCCWASEFSEEIAETIIKCDWHQLLIEDKRGQTPLEYVREDTRADWLSFLEERQEAFFPRGGPPPTVRSLKDIRPDGSIPDPPRALPAPLAAAVSAGQVTPEQVKAMDQSAREKYQ